MQVVLGPPSPPIMGTACLWPRLLHGASSCLAAPRAWGTSVLQPGGGSLPLPLGHLTISRVASRLFPHRVTTSLHRISLS